MKVSKLIEINGVYLPQEIEMEDKPLLKDNRTNEEKIESRIRERYSINDELAILRQRDTKREEFNEYFDFVEKCKKQSKI